MTPTCRTCAAPLRWIAEYGQWWCDRCATYVPAAGPAPGPARSTSRALIYAGAGFAAVVAIGVGAALLASDDGGEGRRGGGGAEVVIDASVAALIAGDDARLRGLFPSFERTERLMRCDDEPVEERRADYERDRDGLARLAAAWRRADARKVDGPKPRHEQTFDVGDALASCTVRERFRFAMFEVTLDYEGADQPFDTDLAAMEIEGRWYLVDAGELPSALE